MSLSRKDFAPFDLGEDLREVEPITPNWPVLSRLRVERGSDWRPCVLRLSCSPDPTHAGPLVGVYRRSEGWLHFVSDDPRVMHDEEVAAGVSSLAFPREEVQRVGHLEFEPCSQVNLGNRCPGIIHPETGFCCECNALSAERTRRAA